MEGNFLEDLGKYAIFLLRTLRRKLFRPRSKFLRSTLNGTYILERIKFRIVSRSQFVSNLAHTFL